MDNKIKYETINNGYVTKEQAVAIASCDRNLKDSIFKKWKKEDDLYLGLISFYTFDVGLVKINEDFAWHIKLKSGEWGGTKVNRIPLIRIRKGYENWDGDFDESDNISCIVMCNSGQYYFCDDIDLKELKEPNMEEYKKYIENGSIYYV